MHKIIWQQIRGYLDLRGATASEFDALESDVNIKLQSSRNFTSLERFHTNSEFMQEYEQYRPSFHEPQICGTKGLPEGQAIYSPENKTLEQNAIELLNRTGGPVHWEGSFLESEI